jgi:hypothetical protein
MSMLGIKLPDANRFKKMNYNNPAEACAWRGGCLATTGCVLKSGHVHFSNYPFHRGCSIDWNCDCREDEE